MFIRQGDVLIVKVEQQQDFEGKSERDAILAYGEATGHHHKLAGTVETVREQGEISMFRVVQATSLVHQEHDAITVEPGVYRVVRQREYQRGEIQRVLD